MPKGGALSSALFNYKLQYLSDVSKNQTFWRFHTQNYIWRPGSARTRTQLGELIAFLQT